MKAKIKSSTTDKYLRPIRQQIVDLVPANSTVIEVGCGTGALLFELSEKIEHGVGIDSNTSLIEFASKKAESTEIRNLEFNVINAQEFNFKARVDCTVASSFFHVIPWGEAIETLSKMVQSSEVTIVCGFAPPQNYLQGVLLWFDQRFTSHFTHFKRYRKEGSMDGLLRSSGVEAYEVVDTFDPVIKIYIIRH